jgi:hypothetical protein
MDRLLCTGLIALLGLSFAPAARADQIFQAIGVSEYGTDPTYGLRLNGFFDGSPNTLTTFGFTNVTFTQSTNAATLNGMVMVNNGNPAGHDASYFLNVNFMQVAPPPYGDPTHQYYVIQSNGHELTSVSNPQTDYARLATFPADRSRPFDVGSGAWNGDDTLQAVGWVRWVHYFNGQTIIGDTDALHGDFLMELVPVPEPSTMCLALTAIVGFGWLFRRRSKAVFSR